MKKMFAALPLLVIAAVACEQASSPSSAPATSAAPSAGPSAASAAPANAASAAGARNIPAIDLTCANDAECVTFDEVLTGKEACCPGCTWNVGNKTSVDAFHAACNKSPAPECPALGCGMAITTAKCVAGKCSGVVKH